MLLLDLVQVQALHPIKDLAPHHQQVLVPLLLKELQAQLLTLMPVLPQVLLVETKESQLLVLESVEHPLLDNKLVQVTALEPNHH